MPWYDFLGKKAPLGIRTNQPGQFPHAIALDQTTGYPLALPYFPEYPAALLPDAEQQWTACVSTNVWAFRTAGHGGDNLEVKFLNGSVYVYYGAGYLYPEMYQAPSKGKFVWRYLREDGSYSIGPGFSYQMIVAGVHNWKKVFGKPLKTHIDNPGRWISRIHRPKYPKRKK